MSNSKPLSQAATTLVIFLGRICKKISIGANLGAARNPVDELIMGLGLTDGFDEVAVAYKELHKLPDDVDLQKWPVLAYLAARKAEVERQAQIAALAKLVLETNPKWAAGSGRADLGSFRMFHLFTFTPTQLVHYFGEDGARDITAYFASVGLTHGERLDRELETELRQIGLWRDREAFDPAFAGGNKS